jgi:hypothetical protein
MKWLMQNDMYKLYWPSMSVDYCSAWGRERLGQGMPQPALQPPDRWVTDLMALPDNGLKEPDVIPYSPINSQVQFQMWICSGSQILHLNWVGSKLCPLISYHKYKIYLLYTVLNCSWQYCSMTQVFEDSVNYQCYLAVFYLSSVNKRYNMEICPCGKSMKG